MRNYKKTGKSHYKGVSKIMSKDGKEGWLSTGMVNGLRFVSKHSTEREAALNFDKKMIECGKNPVNILIKK